MVQRIPDGKLAQLGESVSRLDILDVASIKFCVYTQSITFHPKITYTPGEFKKVVEDVTATNKSEQYYADHLGWGFGPDDLTEDQLKLEYALLLAIWERADVTMTYGDDGWKYVIGNEPNYCPVYAPAKKLWDALYGSETKNADDDETYIEEINDRVYVRKGSHEEGFASWADALNAIVEKNGDGPDKQPAHEVVETLLQLYCKVNEYGWNNVGTWRIKGSHTKLEFVPNMKVHIADKDLELANNILKRGVVCGEFSDPVLVSVFLQVPCMALRDTRNNLIRRVIAGMFIALAECDTMYIQHTCGQWKISFGSHTPAAYVNLYNIAEV